MRARKIGKAVVLISFMMSLGPAHAQSGNDILNGLIRLGVGVAVHQLNENHERNAPQPRRSQGQNRSSSPQYATSEVRMWQERLNSLGFDAGPVDGAFGSRTRQAITAYQRSMGAPATGVLTPGQREILLAEPRVMQSEVSPPYLTDTTGYSGQIAQTNVSLSRSEVRQAQNWLNAMGFDAGTADGIFGGQSLAALNAFQRAGGFTPTQDINREVFDQLRSANNMGFAAGERSPSEGGELAVGNHPQITDRGTDNAMATVHALENPGETRRSWDFVVVDDAPVFGVRQGDAYPFLRLARLGAHPGLLDTTEGQNDFALDLAIDHLPLRSPLRDQYLSGNKWIGSNEFERGRTREAFLDAYRDELLGLVPRTPFDVYLSYDRRLPDYHTERGGFVLRLPQLRGITGPIVRGQLESRPDIDELFWALTPSEAETIIEHLARTSVRPGTARHIQFLPRIEVVSIDASGEAVLRLRRIDILDQSFSSKLASFSMEAEPEPLPEGAAVSSLGHLMTPPQGLLPVELAFHNGTALIERDASVHIFALLALKNREAIDPLAQCSLLHIVMTDEVLQRYVDSERYRNCRGADGWLGADEFERADNRAAFWEQYGPAIDAFAPAAPFKIGRMYDALWREYDASKGGFELASSPENVLSDLRRPVVGPKLGLFRNFDWPERIVRLDEADARAFRSRMNTWQQPAKELMVLEISEIDFDRGQAIIDLVSLDILDPTLSETIYSFDVAPTVDTVEVDNRPLAFTEPVELDDLFEAGLIVGTLRGSVDERDQDRLTRELYDRDRLAYRTAQTFANLPSNHVTLPFFPRQVTHRGKWEDTRRDDRHVPRLLDWARAYVDGLPDQAQSLSSISLARDGNTVSIGVADGLGANRLRDVEGVLSQRGWLEEQVLLSTHSDAASILYLLPNRRDLYRLSFDKNWLDGLQSAGRQQLARFEIEDISQIDSDRGQPVVVVSLKPVSLSLLIDGREVASTAFDDVPDLSEAGFVASAEPAAEADIASDAPVPFSHELSDMMIAAHAGPSLSPESQYHLMARRWAHESLADEPFGGRFFVRGAPMPDPRQAQSVLPEYFAWAEANAPVLPLQIAVTATGKWPDDDENVTWGIGCYSYRFSGITSFAHQVRLLSSKRDIRMQGNSSWTDEEEKTLIFARAASVAERLILQPGGSCGAPRVSVEPNDRLETRVLLSATMPQPVAGHGIAPTEFAMDGIVTLSAVEHLDALPTVDDVLPGDYGQYIPAPRTYEFADKDIVALRLEPQSISFRDNGGIEVGAETWVEMAALSADLAAELDAIVPPSASGAPYGRDIVGIQLGMTFEEAEAIVRDHMEVGKVLQGRRAFDNQKQTGQTIPLTSGTLFISTDGREMIALIDEPPAAENRVLAAWRRVYLQPGIVQPSQILAGLEQKYGGAGPRGRLSEVDKNIWNEPSGNGCRGLYQWGQPQALASRWTEDGSEFSIADPEGRPMLDAVYPKAFMDPLGQSRAEVSTCGPFLTAQLDFSASRSLASGYGARGMDVVEQTLTDFGPYIEAFEASRARMADQAASPGSGAFDAAFGPDMVGLRLGMAIQEAEGIVLSRLGEGTRKYESTGLAHYGSGAAYAAEGNREIIALLEDPAAPGRLIAAWRRIYAPAGTSSTAILGDIVAKYGQPVWSNDESSQYFFADSINTACDAALGTYFSPDRRMTELWRPAEGDEGQAWAMPDGFNDPHAPRLLATLPETESAATCPTVFGVALNLNYEGGFIDTALTDQDRTNAMQQSPSAGSVGADAGIKF